MAYLHLRQSLISSIVFIQHVVGVSAKGHDPVFGKELWSATFVCHQVHFLQSFTEESPESPINATRLGRRGSHCYLGSQGIVFLTCRDNTICLTKCISSSASPQGLSSS